MSHVISTPSAEKYVQCMIQKFISKYVDVTVLYSNIMIRENYMYFSKRKDV
jgi:hypothetical protein